MAGVLILQSDEVIENIGIIFILYGNGYVLALHRYLNIQRRFLHIGDIHSSFARGFGRIECNREMIHCWNP